ncbi:peptidoglycan-binding protein [Coprothermobacteraceae bacterium]|nr:peptidoglycan-binding protein [Coprothermobacteraceae bacterium]
MPTQKVKVRETVRHVVTPYTNEKVAHVLGLPGTYQAKKSDGILVLQKVEVSTQTTYAYIPPKVVVRPSNTVAQGKVVVLDPGQPTIKKQTWQVTLVDGKTVSKKLVNEVLVREGTTKVVALGQGVYRGQAVEMLMIATAYTAGEPGVNHWTATGTRVRYGIVAVDPKVIPLGTRLYVEGYGYAVAADTGGAIKGNRIDLYFNTREECIKWGRRLVKVYVLGEE